MIAITASKRTAPLTQADHTLESSRDSGFDLSAAVGEVVDNSAEAKATMGRIRTTWADDRSAIESIAFADDGIGIDPDILANVLSLGYSSRYNSRTGMGRFGMGLKLASLSQARRIDVYTRPLGSEQLFHTSLDLDLVAEGSQAELVAEPIEGFPADLADLMANPRSGTPFTSGTLVVWSKVDRLVQGGRYGTSVDERLQDLIKFLARAYRKFIDQGFYIELDGRMVTLHDPLFLMENPRVTKRFGTDLRGRIVDEHDFEIDGHAVKAVVTLLPRELRRRKGAGGRATKGAEEFKDLYIPDNEGKISILRQGREIYYDLVPKLYPGGKERLDRYIGVEVSFPATLDEYFQVRNVKRGAEPVSKLREELRKFLKNPVEVARKEIRDYWGEVKRAEQTTSTRGHTAAMDAVSQAEQTAPQGRAGLDATAEEADRKFDELIGTLNLDLNEPEDAAKAEAVRQSFEQRPISVADGAWPGKELFDITHLYGKAIVTLNHRHPFIAEIYEPVKELAGKDPAELGTEDLADLITKIDVALDVLFMAYAKAENLHPEPDETYGDLRSQWGIAAAVYVREALGSI